MYLLVAAIVIAVLFLVLFEAIKWRREGREEKAAEQKLEEEAAMKLAKVNQALAGDREAEESVYEAWSTNSRGSDGGWMTENPYRHWLGITLSTEDFEGVRRLCHKIYLQRDYDARISNIQTAHAGWLSSLKSDSFLIKYKAGHELRFAIRVLDPDTNQARAFKELGLTDHDTFIEVLTDMARQHADELWQRAQEDVKAYFELQKFIRAAWKKEILEAGSVRKNQPQLRVFYPEGWNQLTAEHLYDPSFSDFAVREFTPGEGLRRAVEVVNYGGTWVEAAIVLAWSNSSQRARNEVGEELRTQLQEKVVAARRCLVVDRQAAASTTDKQ